MNFQKVQRKNRKAISPVLATVILIAITLIAAVAIAGFVFGLFGSFTSNAQVQASAVNVSSSLAHTGLTVGTCVATGSTNYILAQNTGTSAATVNSVTFSFGGKTENVAAAAGCTVAAGGSTQVPILTVDLGATPASGEQFTGSLSMSNGASVPFSGTFT